MSTSPRPWSCDTFAVAASHTTNGATLFGKNSDRPARESQPLRWLDSRRGNARLRLAYVDVDDVEETIPHIGSSPYWCWGHETGMNPYGVTIGNEALFTRDVAAAAAADRAGRAVEPGILGMELLRLGLERAQTSREAVAVMTELVERYGQYGAGTAGKDRASAAYDNSYLIADGREIWILETSGRRWVTKQVTDAYWALSNEPTIREDWDDATTDLQEYAREQGWHSSTGRVDFADSFVDPQVPLQVSHIRLQRSRSLLGEATSTGGVGFEDARRVLSDHYEGTFLDGPKFNPARPDFHTLCMHEHPSGFTWGNTASSVIAVLPRDGRPYLWWAATTPCTSVYIPVAVSGQPLPPALSTAGTQDGAGPNPEKVSADTFTANSYWWNFQALLEAVAGDAHGGTYRERHPTVRARFDELQGAWFKEVDGLANGGSDSEWQALTARCTNEALAAVEDLLNHGASGSRL